MQNSLLILSLFLTDEKHNGIFIRFIIVNLLINKQLKFEVTKRKLILEKSGLQSTNNKFESLILSQLKDERLTLHQLLKRIGHLRNSELIQLLKTNLNVDLYKKQSLKQQLFGYQELNKKYFDLKVRINTNIISTCKELRKRSANRNQIYQDIELYSDDPMLIVIIARLLTNETIHLPASLDIIKFDLMKRLNVSEKRATDLSNIIYYIIDSVEQIEHQSFGIDGLDRVGSGGYDVPI